MHIKKLIVCLSLLLPFSVKAEILERQIVINNGERIKLDLIWPCTELEYVCSSESIAIKKNPDEGVLISGTDTVAHYQHGGTSLEPDHFSYVIQRLPSFDELTIRVHIEIKVSNAKAIIVSPVDGARMTGSSVTVEYRITGTGYDHAHIQLNKQGHNAIPRHSSSYTFNDIKPGTHEILISLSNAQHRTLTAPGSTDSIRILVE